MDLSHLYNSNKKEKFPIPDEGATLPSVRSKDKMLVVWLCTTWVPAHDKKQMSVIMQIRKNKRIYNCLYCIVLLYCHFPLKVTKEQKATPQEVKVTLYHYQQVL